MQTAEISLREQFDRVVPHVARVETDYHFLIGQELAMTRNKLETSFVKDGIAPQLHDGSKWADLGSVDDRLTELTFRIIRRDYELDLRQLIAECALEGYYPATPSQAVIFVLKSGMADSRPWLVAPGMYTALIDTRKQNDCVAFFERKDRGLTIGLRAIEIPFKPDYDFLFVRR